MKKHYFLLASLSLGLMVASCQNGLEEVIDESAVQDELANTRADEESANDNAPVVIPLNDSADGFIENSRYTTSLVPISGPNVISGTEVGLFSVTLPPDKSIVWSYNTNLLTLAPGSTTTGLRLKLINTNSTSDTSVVVYIYNSDGSLYSSDAIQVGLNGPHANHCSLQVVRSSDGLEVYPTHNAYMEPYSYYYANFSSSVPYGMTLNWQYTYANYTDNSTNNTSYFQTDDNGYVLLNIYGKMTGSSVWKKLMAVTLY